MTNLNSVRLAAALTLCSGALLGATQITVDPMPPVAICGSPTLSVGYTVTTPFNVGNVFTVELSDAAGSFASPTVIGSVVAIGTGTVQCTFPAGLTGGSGVAIRVVASDPPELGPAYPLPFMTISPPNAGSDDFFSMCSSDAPFIMIDYVAGDPDVGGTWTTPAGDVHSGFFNAAVDPAGCYSYTVQGNAPCPADVSQHCITVVQAANAGISVTETVCTSDAPVALITLLEGSPQLGGTWDAPVFVPGVDLPGCYTYTVPGSAPCPTATSTVCIVVEVCTTISTDQGPSAVHELRVVGGWNSDQPAIALPDDMDANAVVSVIDLTGRVHCVRKVQTTTMTLDLSGYASGVYAIKLIDGDRTQALRLWKD